MAVRLLYAFCVAMFVAGVCLAMPVNRWRAAPYQPAIWDSLAADAESYARQVSQRLPR